MQSSDFETKPSFDEISQNLVQGISQIVSGSCPACLTTEILDHLHDLLLALPLACGEFCKISNRIANAERYFAFGETGAARYELRLVAQEIRAGLKGDAADQGI